MTTKKTKASKKVEDNGRNVYSALITTLGKPLSLDISVSSKEDKVAHFKFVWDGLSFQTYHLPYCLLEDEDPKKLAHALTGALILDPKFAVPLEKYDTTLDLGEPLNWADLYPIRGDIASMIEEGFKALPLLV